VSAPTHLDRRVFLRGTGVALALPLLDAFLPQSARAAAAAIPRRMVCICTSLGLHGPNFFPQQAGRDYQPAPYLQLLGEHRQDYTILSGLSHPDQSGSDGHSSGMTWLTSARHPGLGGFRNTISVDQLAAERIGFETRFPSLQLGTGGSSQSCTRSGVLLPADSRPSQVFARLFLAGTPEEVAAGVRKLREGRSILDAVRAQAERFAQRVGKADQAKLEEYFTSVREMEVRLTKAEEWMHRPKPQVDAQQPQDIANESDLIGRTRLLFDLIPLAVQTDSTRLITVLVDGRNDVPPVPGVSIDHHNLSHHGQDEGKIAQLQLIEEAKIRALNDLLAGLKARREAAGTLLDNTMLLFGSNLGNANAHDPRNLPLLLAGGGFRHGQHLAFDAQDNVPLSNLYVQMLRQMGLEVDVFGSSSASSIAGLETA
jgi:hypothetical protein